MSTEQDERKLPKVMATFVTDLGCPDQIANKHGGSHVELRPSPPLDWIFLTHDSAVPEVGELVVVRRTNERPAWWENVQRDGHCWLWEVVRDE